MTSSHSKPIVTEDHATVYSGDTVYDYYTMEVVQILSDPDPTGWFSVSGQAKLLNGQRICTVAFAKRRGFPGV